jgi:hypothetical protein
LLVKGFSLRGECTEGRSPGACIEQGTPYGHGVGTRGSNELARQGWEVTGCAWGGGGDRMKEPAGARYQWLTPVILAIQKAKIRRIRVQRQPRRIV